MLENINSIAFLFASQAIVFAILSFIFFIYFRVYSRRYVKCWLFSFTALSGYYFSSALLHNDNSYLFVSNYLQLFYTQVQQSTLYLFLVFFYSVYIMQKNKKNPNVPLTLSLLPPPLLLA